MTKDDDTVSKQTPAPPTSDVAALGYEEARDELIQIVARLESGGEPLEASLALWERGEALAARCQQWLDGARERIDTAQAQGREATTPLAGDDES